MRRDGITVRFANVPMVDHRTLRVTRLGKLLGNLSPRFGSGKKYFGFGQLLHSRVMHGQVGSLVRYYPDPFVFWALLLAALVALAAGLELASGLVGLIALAYVGLRKGIRFGLIYLLLLGQAIRGWRRYEHKYEPLPHRVRHDQ